jgi:hypothetical protein
VRARTIGRVRPRLPAAPFLGLLVLCCALALALAPAARAAGARKPTVTAVLQRLLQAGEISEASYHADEDAYIAAKQTLARLAGTRHFELAAVLANVQAMAASGALSASLAPEAFLTIERNREEWSTAPLPAADAHVGFPGSELVWEYYPGQGVEIQWLATFGEGNGYYGNHESADLRQLLSEAIPLAAQRAGGIAWEYMFEFDGGAPPWTSGLSQGTAVQLLARAWGRLQEAPYLEAAQQALHLFGVPPPQGVRVATPAGALYAEYTFAPSDRILNGFIQALVGLYDYTSITKDALGEQLFEAGDAEARVLVPQYNTGAWSKYDQYFESNLNYHELLEEFLAHLCERTRLGEPLDPVAGALSADAVYCATAEAFTADLHTPPVVALLSTKLQGGTRAGVEISLSKVATVALTVREGTRVVRSVAATLERGQPRLLWVTPAKGGSFTASVSATDLAGNRASATGTLLVEAQRPARRKHGAPPRRAPAPNPGGVAPG